MKRREIISILHSLLPEMRERFHLVEIGLFGSFARGEENEGSDIDILVEMENGYNDLFNILDLKEFLEANLRNKVDLVQKEGVRPALRNRILEETVYV